MSLRLDAGQILGIVGKSGSGKTTLIKCIYGLEDLAGGEILLEGSRVLGPSYNLMPGHEDMKLVSQDFYVLDNHTVEENIFDKLIGYPNEAKQKRAAKIMKLLELGHLKNTRARFLSSGQKQRVAIARAFAVIPKLLLLDEPFSNLDKLLTEKLFAFIMEEVRRHKTAVILITHMAEEALKYADAIAVMDDGKIVQAGEKWEVYYKPSTRRLAGLLGDFNLLRREDLEGKRNAKENSRIFLRPDKLILSAAKTPADIYLEVINCVYNGKCYEVLGETKLGYPVMVYSGKALTVGKQFGFSIRQ